jgi:hypothetical protein
MSPPDVRSGPQAIAKPGSRSIKAENPAKSLAAGHTLTRRKAEPVYVSLLWPAGRRSCFWYLATCRTCGRPHLGRARELANVTRTRRLPCGHWVRVLVARTYGRPEAAA